MELKVKSMTFPDAIEFNFDELKQEITERASSYVGLVYTEEQIKDAKKDVANLRKFTKALSDERIRIKKQCLQPYEDFEMKIKELSGIVDKAIANIDTQVKGYEEQEKAKKLEAVKRLWEALEPPSGMKFEQVFKEKFLNKSCSMGTVMQYFKDDIARFNRDIVTLQNLPEFSFEAIEVYKTSFDLNMAISEGKRLAGIQKRKEEAARQKEEDGQQMALPVCEESVDAKEEAVAEVITEPEKAENRVWLGFKAFLTVQDAQALANLFAARGIEYAQIEI